MGRRPFAKFFLTRPKNHVKTFPKSINFDRKSRQCFQNLSISTTNHAKIRKHVVTSSSSCFFINFFAQQQQTTLLVNNNLKLIKKVRNQETSTMISFLIIIFISTNQVINAFSPIPIEKAMFNLAVQQDSSNLHSSSYKNHHNAYPRTSTNNVLQSIISSSSSLSSRHHPIQLKSQRNSDNDNGDKIENENIVAKSSWYAAEVFGKLFGSSTSSTTQTNDNNDTSSSSSSSSLQSIEIDLTTTPSSIQETLERIKLDNDRYYFLSGKVDSKSYDPQCYFADPFVGFKGTDRFIDNLQNLGSFITKYDVKLLNYEVSENELEVKTRLMVKLELNLPWKPILAWPWGVSYDIDPETFLIVSHVESWDIDALEGVKQVFRKPTLTI